jgi:hypothetical protein
MPLLRWPPGGCEPHMWGINFLMMTRDGTTIRCEVTRGVLDKLLNDNGGLTELGQQGVFDEYRSQIENVASQKYDCGHVEDGVIVVRPEDVEKAGLAAAAKAG